MVASAAAVRHPLKCPLHLWTGAEMGIGPIRVGMVHVNEEGLAIAAAIVVRSKAVQVLARCIRDTVTSSR